MESLHRHSNLNLLGVCDKLPERAKVLADYYGLDIYDTVERKNAILVRIGNQ